ncbi:MULTISPECIES: phosphoadenosine phosphosulfate reductase family protein [unclassified Thiocapsa]|uniref:phosphoadenosine phosphosulfate reductase domain-containing protein n=1 Tax=unclassified Thiocapsa TaxID=2641286 RepID=UPI0035B37CF8
MVTRHTGSSFHRRGWLATDAGELTDKFATLDAVSRIRAAYRLFEGKVLLTTSGGETSAVMLDLTASVIGMEYPVVFVDHGYHTDATYQMIDGFRRKGHDVHVFRSRLSPSEVDRQYPGWREPGSPLFEQVTRLIKHQPLNQAFTTFRPKAWLRGIMRYETSDRARANFVQRRNGLFQIHPILDWSPSDVNYYIAERQLPVNTGHWDITKGREQRAECRIGEFCGTAPERDLQVDAAVRAQAALASLALNQTVAVDAREEKR